MITIQNYVRAQSLQEAYELNQKKRNRIIGGMLWLKMTNLSIATAIDLSDLGLDTIEETEDSFRIGAMVTLRQLETHEGFNAYSQEVAAKSVESIVGVQFRNLATVGGSIFGRFGFSDVMTAFLAMDTYVELYQGGIVPLEEFAAMKKDRDILVRLIVKKTPGSFAYETMRTNRTDFPTLTCAVSCMDGQYRAVIGARPGLAKVYRDEEGILAGGITAQKAEAFGQWMGRTVPVGNNLRGSGVYRSRLACVLTQRALLELGGTQHGD